MHVTYALDAALAPDDARRRTRRHNDGVVVSAERRLERSEGEAGLATRCGVKLLALLARSLLLVGRDAFVGEEPCGLQTPAPAKEEQNTVTNPHTQLCTGRTPSTACEANNDKRFPQHPQNTTRFALGPTHTQSTTRRLSTTRPSNKMSARHTNCLHKRTRGGSSKA